MKTITEMQAQIKEMSSKLDEFAKELSDYNKTEKQREAIDFKQIKAIGVRNPIIGHILEKVDEVTKKKYITMLIAIVYMASENQENAWLLIQRIAAGANFTEELIDLSVDAVNITDAQIDEFTLNIANEKLTNIFVLDAMLIYLSCESSNEKMLEFLAALFELVKCGKKEVHELTELAKSISSQDNNIYNKLVGKKLNISLKELVYYTRSFVTGILYNENNCICLNGGKSLVDFNDNLYEQIKESDEIIISKFKFSLNRRLIFENLSIKFHNCEFDKSNFDFDNCNKVNFDNCSFMSLKNRTAYLNSVRLFVITNCKFTSCGYDEDSYTGSYGGIFYISNSVENFQVKNSMFINCYVSNKRRNTNATGVIAYSSSNQYVRNIVISDCYFENNQCINNCYSKEALFYSMSGKTKTIKNNIIIGKVKELFD